MDAIGMSFCDWLVTIIAGRFCQFFFMREGGSVDVTPLTGYTAMNEILESIMTTQTLV
jgi:hypothetical protein